MKCPKCCREIDNQDSFCGFCGAKIELSEKSVKKKNRKAGIKIFLFFSIMAMLSGTVLGFCLARGIINWEELVKQNEFHWTDFSEAVIETDNPQNEESEKGVKRSDSKEVNGDTETSEENSTQED